MVMRSKDGKFAKKRETVRQENPWIDTELNFAVDESFCRGKSIGFNIGLDEGLARGHISGFWGGTILASLPFSVLVLIWALI